MSDGEVRKAKRTIDDICSVDQLLEKVEQLTIERDGLLQSVIRVKVAHNIELTETELDYFLEAF